MVATTRSVFDHQLNELQFKTLQLSELVATQAVQAVKALQKRDMTVAQHVADFDTQVNQLRFEIEEQCYTLLALQQPNSHDMRRIVATVSVVTNLERMGDHAANIARLTLSLGNLPPLLTILEFNDMEALANANLTDAMSALAHENVNLARDVIHRDKQIDGLHETVYQRLLQSMVSSPSTVEYATRLLSVSHDLERYADRVANICERILYLTTGNLREPNEARTR